MFAVVLDLPWTVHGGLSLECFSFFFLSEDINAGGIRGELKTHHLRVNLGQMGLKTCKKYERTILTHKMETYSLNYNIKLMNFLKMQQKDLKNAIMFKHLSMYVSQDLCFPTFSSFALQLVSASEVQGLVYKLDFLFIDLS